MEQSQKELLIQAMHRLKRTHTWNPPLGNISRGEFFMLNRIAHLIRHMDEEKPGAKITDLSIAAEMSKPAVSQMLNSLENKDMIERVTTKSDRRVVYVRLTDNGKAQLDMAGKRFGRLMEEIVEKLGQEDTAELVRIFDKLNGILEDLRERGE